MKIVQVDFCPSEYCASESMYIVLWTHLGLLSADEQRQALKEKMKEIKRTKYPAGRFVQNIMAAIPELREGHDSFVRSLHNDLSACGVVNEVCC